MPGINEVWFPCRVGDGAWRIDSAFLRVFLSRDGYLSYYEAALYVELRRLELLFNTADARQKGE